MSSIRDSEGPPFTLIANVLVPCAFFRPWSFGALMKQSARMPSMTGRSLIGLPSRTFRMANYIAVDLNPAHSGLCYDAFHETFWIPGHVNIIASSFTDLLERLLNTRQIRLTGWKKDFSPWERHSNCMDSNPWPKPLCALFTSQACC